MKLDVENKAFSWSAGVCAGIANDLGTDPGVIRILWIAGTLATGLVPGLIVYAVAAAIMGK